MLQKIKIRLWCAPILLYFVAGGDCYCLAAPRSAFVPEIVSESPTPCDEGGISRAISFLRGKVTDDPLDEVAAGMLGYRLLEYARRERKFDGLREVERLLESNLARSEALSVKLLRASLYRSQHRFLESLNVIDELLQSSTVLKESERDAARLLAIDLKLELGRIDDASAMISEYSTGDKPALIGVRRAKLAEMSGSLETAAGVVEDLLTKESDDSSRDFEAVWLRLQHGERLVRIGRLVEARKVYEAAAMICPNYWVIEEHLAELDVINGDKSKGLSTYKELAEKKRRAALYESVASILSSNGMMVDSRAAAERARELYVAAVERGETLFLHHLAALLDEQFEMPCAALEYANRDLAGRRTAVTLQQTAWIAFRCGKKKLAGRLIEEALGKGYSDAHFNYRAGVILSGLGKRDRGRQLITKATKDNPWVNAFHAHR